MWKTLNSKQLYFKVHLFHTWTVSPLPGKRTCWHPGIAWSTWTIDSGTLVLKELISFEGKQGWQMGVQLTGTFLVSKLCPQGQVMLMELSENILAVYTSSSNASRLNHKAPETGSFCGFTCVLFYAPVLWCACLLCCQGNYTLKYKCLEVIMLRNLDTLKSVFQRIFHRTKVA